MIVQIETSGEFPDFHQLLASFPELSVRILGYIGRQAALQLFEEHLQGQDITYHNVTRSPSGTPRHGESKRRLVTYSIGRGLKWVGVSSFPLNLYENIRRDNRRGDEARRGILRRKFASGLSGRINTYIAQSERLIVDDWFINRKKRGGGRDIGWGAISRL